MNEECEGMEITSSDDSNVNPPVCMDLLVDDQPDVEDDYREAVNKEIELQDPDPDAVVESDLEMDPAAATESFLHRAMCMTDEDLDRGTEDLKMFNKINEIGLNYETKSLESIRVVDKMFKDTTYYSVENFAMTGAGNYASAAMKTKFNQVLRPVSMSDYKNNKGSFDNALTKALVNFKTKFLNPNMVSTCSAKVIGPDTYGTTAVNITYKAKDGQTSPLGSIYALEWYKGRPSVSPIVPIMKISQSVEKAFGYFKKSDFKNDTKANKNLKKYKTINTFGDFFNLPVVKSKVDQFKADVKAKGFTLASKDDCRNIKSSFFNKWVRGSDMSSGSNFLGFAYMEKYGVVWATWNKPSLSGMTMNIVGMCLNKKGKLTSVGFVIDIPIKSTAKIWNVDKELSDESYNYDPFSNM